ncbi:ribonuclease H-like domain-containing protein [Tanacetum coccineum]
MEAKFQTETDSSEVVHALSPVVDDSDHIIHKSSSEGVVTKHIQIQLNDLHPNDSTALTVVSTKLKGTENYLVWPCPTLLALEGKNKIAFIDGSCKRSNTDEVLGRQCSIICREVLPHVKSAYATIYSEESYRVAYGSIVGSSQRNQASAFVSNVPNRGHDWHCRLALPAELVLNVLKGSLQINNMDKNVYSETCQRAKQTKEPFPLIDHVSKSLGIDYEETFSPVVKVVIVRCLLNIVVSNSWHVFQLDVNNAFLYGDLDEVVYMKPPEGYFPSGNKVCRLKKSLYGLKQALRKCNEKLTSTLIENSFCQSKSDYFLYTKSDKGVFLALLVYVDDIMITGNNVYEIEKFKVFVKSKFMIRDLGKLKYFLGIKVVDTNKGICLNQRKYVLDLKSEHGMLACKPLNTPLMSKLVISNEATKKYLIFDNITNYCQDFRYVSKCLLMGEHLYLTNTSLGISYDVHCLS